jgi:hypothetical protein
MGQITDDFAKQLAAHSVPAVMAAQVIEPLPNEQLVGSYQHVHHSPVKQDYQAHQQPTFDEGYILRMQSPEREGEGVEDVLHEDWERAHPDGILSNVLAGGEPGDGVEDGV